MPLNTLYIYNCYFVEAQGALDAETYRQMKQILDDAIKNNVRNVWVNCEQVSAISTEVQRMMLQHSTKAAAAGINLLFYHVSNPLTAAFQESGLDSILHIVPSVKDAYVFSKHQNDFRPGLR